MEKNELDEILKDCNELIKNSSACLKEIKAMDKEKEFLINEYKTNKRWFRDEPGRVTIEDIIKRAFEFGWSSKSNYDAHPELYAVE